MERKSGNCNHEGRKERKLQQRSKEKTKIEMLPVQDSQPRIRFRPNDTVTVLMTIEHVDNQQLGSFSQRDMENIVISKMQKLKGSYDKRQRVGDNQGPDVVCSELQLRLSQVAC
jgi:hypothetical protein